MRLGFELDFLNQFRHTMNEKRQLSLNLSEV